MAARSDSARKKRSQGTKEWKKKNPERVKAHRRKLYLKKQKFLHSLKNKPCSECGGTFPACVMDFHHREPKNSAKELINWGWSNQRILLEVAKCDLLCANCHRIKTWLPC